MMLLGPIGGAAVAVISNARNVERTSSVPPPVSAICLLFLIIGAFCWWMVEWLDWGADRNKVRLGSLIALSPLILLLICGVIWGN